MKPYRKTTIKGLLIEEYYWAGLYVTYVNNRKSELSYDELVKKLKYAN